MFFEIPSVLNFGLLHYGGDLILLLISLGRKAKNILARCSLLLVLLYCQLHCRNLLWNRAVELYCIRLLL